jgi:hypothetical protein
MAGTSFADESGTVKVDVVVVPCDGVVGDEESPHPTARMVRPMTRSESRFMLFCLSLDSLRRISGRD